MTTTVAPTSVTRALVANTEDQVKFSSQWGVVRVSITGAGVAWVRTDGTAATVAGTNCRPVVEGGIDLYLLQAFDGLGASTRNPVSIISSGTPTYTIEGINLPPMLADLASAFLSLAGGTMAGPINMDGNDITNIGNTIDPTTLPVVVPAGTDHALVVVGGVVRRSLISDL